MAAEGIMLRPGEGERISGKGLDVVLLAPMEPAMTSSFVVGVQPGYDVGAHVHGRGEEIFYVLEGELEFLVFEPVDRTVPDWHDWESPSGKKFIRGGPGQFMFIPEGVPHAFGNPTDQPARVFFQSSVPGGHEHYFEELAEILARSAGGVDQDEIEDLRRRYDIEQLTPLAGGAVPGAS
jgi:quercetin dioxygenase-like cupin family protein